MVLPVISAILLSGGRLLLIRYKKISYENGQWNDSDIGENASMDFVSCGDYVIKFRNHEFAYGPELKVYGADGEELFSQDLDGIER